MAIAGTTVVVGAPSRNSFTGAAYVFVSSSGVWSQQAELTASDGGAGDYFGWSVGFSGSSAVVGAFGPNSLTGVAYVFTRSGSIWSQAAELTASDGAAGDYFGWAVAISGSNVVVGAPNRNSLIGSTYIFTRTGSIWSQAAEVAASDGAAGDSFGWAVAISGANVVVGAPLKNDDTGAAYVFVNSGGIWSQQAELTAADAAARDWFANTVAISRSIAIISAFNKGPQHAGVAYVFRGTSGIWSQVARLTASDATAYDNFGYSVAVDRSTFVVGSPGHGANGAAYVLVNA